MGGRRRSRGGVRVGARRNLPHAADGAADAVRARCGDRGDPRRKTRLRVRHVEPVFVRFVPTLATWVPVGDGDGSAFFERPSRRLVPFSRRPSRKSSRHRREERRDGVRREPDARHATRQGRRREAAGIRRSERSSGPGFDSGAGSSRGRRGYPRADADADAAVVVVVVVVTERVRRRLVKVVKADPHVGIRPNPRAPRQSHASVGTSHHAEHSRRFGRVAAGDRGRRDGVQRGAIAGPSRQLARRVGPRLFQPPRRGRPGASPGLVVRRSHRTLRLVHFFDPVVVRRRTRTATSVHLGIEPGTAGRRRRRLRRRLLDEPEGLAGVVAEQPGDRRVVSSDAGERVVRSEPGPDGPVVAVRALHRREDAVEVHGDELGGGGGHR